MFRDFYSMMITKYAADAEDEIAASGRRVAAHKQRAANQRQLYRVVKYCLLGIAVAGVGAALYFAHDLGGLAANVTTREPDPSLIAQPDSNIKKLRKLAEMKKQHQSALDEIDNFNAAPAPSPEKHEEGKQ